MSGFSGRLGKITKPQSEQTMTLPRFGTGSARTCPTIPGRYLHTMLPNVTVLQPEQAECALQFYSVAPTPSFSMSQCYNLNKQNMPYNCTASPLHQDSRCHSVTTWTSKMCPTILDRRSYTKLHDVTVLQPKVRASYSLLSDRTWRLFNTFTCSTLQKPILILF